MGRRCLFLLPLFLQLLGRLLSRLVLVLHLGDQPQIELLPALLVQERAEGPDERVQEEGVDPVILVLDRQFEEHIAVDEGVLRRPNLLLFGRTYESIIALRRYHLRLLAPQLALLCLLLFRGRPAGPLAVGVVGARISCTGLLAAVWPCGLL